MRGLDLAGLRRVLLAAAAAAAAAAVLVWALVTWWLPVLAILGTAGLLVLLLRHGGRLSLAYWPSRHQAHAGNTPRPAITTSPQETEQDPWQ